MHIIIEGPDGSGKTTLIGDIGLALPWYKRSPRSSSSVGGPVPNLEDWTVQNVRQMGTVPPSLFDRHPLISEPIYGPLCRGAVPGKFNEEWWVRSMTYMIASQSILILCLPPLRFVQENIQESAQMPGVVDNIKRIWAEYDKYAAKWPGVMMRHDYTRRPFNLDLLRKVMS